jgi:hypothetical protein
VAFPEAREGIGVDRVPTEGGAPTALEENRALFEAVALEVLRHTYDQTQL